MTSPFVFDTGPLRHFATEGWLGVLAFLTEDRGAVIPETVERELLRQVDEIPVIRQVLDASWLTVDRSDDLTQTMAFATFAQMLMREGSDENRGEVGVLALGKARNWEMVLDDRAARTIAEAEGLEVTATLPLLCQAIRAGQLTVPMVEHLADDLIRGEYHLPFALGEFHRWAYHEGLV